MSRPKPTRNELREELRRSAYVFSRLGSTSEVTSMSRAPKTTMTEAEWLTPKEAADRARCGVKTIYTEAKAGRLRAARVSGRRELRIKPEWVDEWLENATTPEELTL